MPIGYITENNGESRYTVAVPRSTTLLAALIAARRKEIEGIDVVLGELTGHEVTRRATYDAVMAALNQALIDYQTCRNGFVPSACESAREAEIEAAYTAARGVCDDTHQDCLLACDIGDRDCQDACDEARDACEEAAEAARDRDLAAVERLCQDDLIEHLAVCQAQWAPIIAGLQADATEALTPLQDTLIAITWERSKRLAAARRLTELEGIESGADMRVTWSAQYRDDLPTGPVPENPTGDEENAVQVALIGDSPHITEIAPYAPGKCLNDARALPAGTLLIDAALQPGVETWRPSWRRGVVLGQGEEAGTLKVRVEPLILYGTLGTAVSSREINCTPPGRFFDDDGELDAQVGAARQDYADALFEREEIREDIHACKDAYTLLACQTAAWSLCEQSRDASRLDCLDARSACLSAGGSVEYCDARYAECIDQVDAIYSACIDEATANCGDLKAAHDAQCDRVNAGALADAETAVSNTLRALLIQIGNFEGPATDLELELPVEHCQASTYQADDVVLIDFPTRTPSAELDWRTATAEMIRSAAMAVWNSARIIGWAWNTRQCSQIMLAEIGISSGGAGATCYGYPLKAGALTWGDAHALFEAAFDDDLTIEYAVAAALDTPVVWQPMVQAARNGAGGQAFYAFESCGDDTTGHAPQMIFYAPPRVVECPPFYRDGDAVYQAYLAIENELNARRSLCMQLPAGDERNDCLHDVGDWYDATQNPDDRDGSWYVDAHRTLRLALEACWSQGYFDPDDECQAPAYAAHAAALAPLDAAVEAVAQTRRDCLRNNSGTIPPGTDLTAPAVYGTDYYGILFSGDGYISCESSQWTYGNPVQRYRITGADDVLVGEFTIHYVGLQPFASNPVTQVQTDAILSPTIDLNANVPTPIVGLGATPDPAP